MLSYLKGKIINKGKGFVIVVVQDLGYQVFVNSLLHLELDRGREVELYLHHHIKEDASDLYGFRNLEELEMFELLLSISGIGPKSALGVTSVASVDDIRESIARGDSSLLTKVSGIGKKTAERVVLELRDKIGTISTKGQETNTGSIQTSSDEIDALMALGYSLQQARDALKKVDPSITKSGERIRKALQQIN